MKYDLNNHTIEGTPNEIKAFLEKRVVPPKSLVKATGAIKLLNTGKPESRKHKSWRPEEIARLKSLLGMKISHRKIARELGRATNAIRVKTCELNRVSVTARNREVSL